MLREQVRIISTGQIGRLVSLSFDARKTIGRDPFKAIVEFRNDFGDPYEVELEPKDLEVIW